MEKVSNFLKLVKFEHSIFALPFAYLGLFLSSKQSPGWHVFAWVTIAMVSIRTAAMCLNRLIDKKIDAENPRTKDRINLLESLSLKRVWIITYFAIGIFLWACFQLNPLCLKLSPIPIILIWLYPYLKKITWFSHFILGMILGLAPYGGWLANTGKWSWLPLILTAIVVSWVSSFDMLYAFQDLDFDRKKNLKSFPAQYGISKTLIFASVLHCVTLVLLAAYGWLFELGIIYWTGWLIVGGLIFREHFLVHRFGIEKIDEAFFQMNAWVSVVVFVVTVLNFNLKV